MILFRYSIDVDPDLISNLSIRFSCIWYIHVDNIQIWSISIQGTKSVVTEYDLSKSDLRIYLALSSLFYILLVDIKIYFF